MHYLYKLVDVNLLEQFVLSHFLLKLIEALPFGMLEVQKSCVLRVEFLDRVLLFVNN